MALYIEQSRALSEIRPVVHGFFARNAGVSSGDFASLNCSFKTADLPVNVQENRKRAMKALGLGKIKLLVPNLVHGDQAIVVDSASCPSAIEHVDADALITADNDIALGITYADCVPILLASDDGHVIGVIHAGWRGIKYEVIIKTVQKIKAVFMVNRLIAVLGPAISQSGFVVSGEAKAFFLRRWPKFVSKDYPPGVDLTGIAYEQLKSCGIGLSLIDKVGGYTDINPLSYFSHRRDHGKTGRHLALIAKCMGQLLKMDE
jgi:YfiH family protein